MTTPCAIRNVSRREVLKASTALAATAVFAEPAKAAPPPPASVTPELVEAARKEGKLSYYSALELNVAERLGKVFEAKYPGIAVRVERSGAERIYQRIAQEQGSGINAVDVANSTDPAHYLDWKSKAGWRLICLMTSPNTFRRISSTRMGPTRRPAPGWRRSVTTPIWSSAEDAPKSYADLLDPKWQGKIVKAHPGYCGAILTATFVLSRDLGWPYFENLAQQKVMQVQSAADPPKKILLGERAVMADGNDYNLVLAQGPGQAGRGSLPERRLTADHRASGRIPKRAQSKCGTAVPELLLQRGRPAIAGRRLTPFARSMRKSRKSPATAIRLR